MLLKSIAVVLASAVLALPLAQAGEVEIRKNLPAHLPELPKIDEVRPSAMPGLWEVRSGTDIVYTDAQGQFLIQGDLFDARTHVNLTEERVAKVSQIEFSTLPLKDAMVWVKGTGKRHMAVFADPNCGYCKRLELALQEVKDVTVYTFMIPVLGGDSDPKARAIWCAKDQTSTWRNWMLNATPIPRPMGACDTGAVDRNLALSRKIHVSGTPAIFFEDGVRVPGAIDAAAIEKHLQSAPAPAKS